MTRPTTVSSASTGAVGGGSAALSQPTGAITATAPTSMTTTSITPPSALPLALGSSIATEQLANSDIAELRQGETDLDVVGGHLDNYLRLSFYQGGAQETFHYLHRCSYIRFGAPLSSETRAVVLLTSQHLYLLLWSHGKQDYELRQRYTLGEITKVVVGLFYQFVRIECGAGVGHVLLSRNHTTSHEMAERLVEAIGDRVGRRGPGNVSSVLEHTVKETLRNVSIELLAQAPAAPAVQAYMMVYLCTSTPSYDGYYKPKSAPVGAIEPRSLILTNNMVYLCLEDYARWPTCGRFDAPSTPQFAVTHKQTIEDVLGIVRWVVLVVLVASWRRLTHERRRHDRRWRASSRTR